MFRVIATMGQDEEFERWIDALEAAKALMPGCRGWTQEVRILDEGELVWSYTRSHKYPQFIGPGTYNRLARQFLQEAAADEARAAASKFVGDRAAGGWLAGNRLIFYLVPLVPRLCLGIGYSKAPASCFIS